MRSTNWVFVIRGGVASSLVALFLLCLLNGGAAVAQAAEANQATTAPLALGSGYGRPDGSARVRVLQQRLRALGQQPGPVDGLYGPLTEAAVRRYQSAAGLAVDGIAGPQTMSELHAEWPQPVALGAGYGQGGGSAQVRAVQRRLRTAKQSPGPADGVFGRRTEAAVIRFQSNRDLAADGVVGPQTWRALERARTRYVTRREAAKVAMRRVLAKLMPQTGARRSTLVLSKLPSEGSDEPDLNLFVLLVLAATAFAVATLAHVRLRRRVLAPAGRAVAGSAGGLLPGAVAHQVANRAGARPHRPAHNEGKQQNPSSPPFSASRVEEAREESTVRAVGYVSGRDARALTGPAVRKQIAAIDEICEQRGWELTEIVRDVTSPTGEADSGGLAYALEGLAGQKPSCLVVAELGRLSGSPAELGRIIQTLRERNVRLLAVDADLDTETGEGRVAADALMSVGQMDHGTPSQASVQDLPALRNHIVAMRSSGMTLQAIADRLNAEGVPTLRGGKLWRPSSVQVALGYRRPGQGRSVGSLPQGQIRSGRRER
jgi:peptidoglycan hydrolase-like protein with peptidoglycan-binding domain